MKTKPHSIETLEPQHRSHVSKAFRFKTSLLVVLAAALASSPVRSHAAPPDSVRSWNELALQTVRTKSASDAAAARLYAMVNVAMYDAVNGIIARNGNKGRDYALVPSSKDAKGDQSVAASAAAHAVLSGEYPDLQASHYDPQLASDLAAVGESGKTSDGQAWGAYVGAQVRVARANDGSSPNESQAPDPNPVGHFRASWSGVQFRNLKPFGIADSSVYFGDGPAPLTSIDYAAAFAEVKIVGNAANPDQGKLETFQFWSLSGGTSQPPGAWIQVALSVTATHPLELPEMTRLFALVSMAMVDTVAPTVMTKYVYRHWRPFHAIREADTDGNPLTDPDPGWVQRANNIGTSPEYWSGHSSFSAAAAAALAGFFHADNIEFALQTDSAPAGQTRIYPSFSSAANEAGQSRVVGGIHFRFSNEEGLEAGRAVAAEILAKKLLLRKGATHFGEGPL